MKIVLCIVNNNLIASKFKVPTQNIFSIRTKLLKYLFVIQIFSFIDISTWSIYKINFPGIFFTLNCYRKFFPGKSAIPLSTLISIHSLASNNYEPFHKNTFNHSNPIISNPSFLTLHDNPPRLKQNCPRDLFNIRKKKLNKKTQKHFFLKNRLEL